MGSFFVGVRMIYLSKRLKKIKKKPQVLKFNILKRYGDEPTGSLFTLSNVVILTKRQNNGKCHFYVAVEVCVNHQKFT